MFPDGSTCLADSLDNDKLPNANEQLAAAQQVNKTAPPSAGGGEVKLRERRRRESAPVIGVLDPDQPQSACSQQVRGARRVSKGSQRAMLVSCLSEDSALEGLESVGEIHTPKGSRRNFIELMMSSSPQVGPFFHFFVSFQTGALSMCCYYFGNLFDFLSFLVTVISSLALVHRLVEILNKLKLNL